MSLTPLAKFMHIEHYKRLMGQQLLVPFVGYQKIVATNIRRMQQTPRITGKDKDRSTVIYNSHITIRKIPEAAWDYVVNGKPALAWVMDRQCIRTDKASGIVSDANRYAIETVGDPRYPLDLFLCAITVSLETMRIVRALPELEIE